MAEPNNHGVVTEAVSVLQVRVLAEELAVAKSKLAEERRRNEQNLDKRLEDLDRGQLEILRKIEEFPNKYINQNDYDKLERRVEIQGRLVYIGLGVFLVVQVIVVSVIKWHS